ncbi:MAG TPA: hypothetical protein PLM53_15070 [Spirochaetota bacterium]|nr:hypothetical protein [Spirochaetota bacterium]HQF09704.1 hypothetical protein [Spirochaetota bacterium]HQH98418.1 hypothetical protein [Spirochaetota bacterium]HQJ72179.1 hypothetical protein [Spirochaetota bacterium]HRS78491.1 hypothetical protein [Spirochaetota bacterium]
MKKFMRLAGVIALFIFAVACDDSGSREIVPLPVGGGDAGSLSITSMFSSVADDWTGSHLAVNGGSDPYAALLVNGGGIFTTYNMFLTVDGTVDVANSQIFVGYVFGSIFNNLTLTVTGNGNTVQFKPQSSPWIVGESYILCGSIKSTDGRIAIITPIRVTANN